MYKIYIKVVKAIITISNKVIFGTIALTGVVALMFSVPAILVSLNKTLDKLDNDGFKNCISIFTDINLLIDEFIKIDRRWIIYSMLILCILSVIALIIKCIYKNKELVDKIIIGHSSMSNVQFIANTDSDYKVEEINLIDDMKDIATNYEQIKFAINKQDKLIEEFKCNINSKYDYGYMGIAHTPLIFRIGNQIGDEVAITLFHKYRTGNTKVFKELSEDENLKKMGISTKILDKSSNELIVGLSTTFPIKYEELKILKPNDKNILIFSCEELGFDVITSKKQVEHYVQFMMGKIRQVVKDKNITKIHMVLSTSVAMTFALGGAISKHHDPEIIIYHFDQSSSRKYTWGIELFKNYNNCLVVTSDD